MAYIEESFVVRGGGLYSWDMSDREKALCGWLQVSLHASVLLPVLGVTSPLLRSSHFYYQQIGLRRTDRQTACQRCPPLLLQLAIQRFSCCQLHCRQMLTSLRRIPTSSFSVYVSHLHGIQAVAYTKSWPLHSLLCWRIVKTTSKNRKIYNIYIQRILAVNPANKHNNIAAKFG